MENESMTWPALLPNVVETTHKTNLKRAIDFLQREEPHSTVYLSPGSALICYKFSQRMDHELAKFTDDCAIYRNDKIAQYMVCRYRDTLVSVRVTCDDMVIGIPAFPVGEILDGSLDFVPSILDYPSATVHWGIRDDGFYCQYGFNAEEDLLTWKINQ